MKHLPSVQRARGMALAPMRVNRASDLDRIRDAASGERESARIPLRGSVLMCFLFAPWIRGAINSSMEAP